MLTTTTWRAVAAMLATASLLSACGGGGDGEQAQTYDSLALFDPVPTVSSDEAITPFPFDGLFAGFTAPTLNIPNPDAISFVSAVNQLDGFSTTADIFCDIAGFVSFATIPSHLYIINTQTGAALSYGIDYKLQNEAATAPDPLTGQPTPISSQRSRVIIELLKPLSPSTQYLIGLTKGIKTLQGGNVIASPEFTITASATPVAQQTNALLTSLDSTQKATLESLRSSLIYPTVSGLSTLTGISASEFVLAWPFTTQSIGKSLASLASTVAPSTIAAYATGITTATAVGVDGADIYVGIAAVPYYLKNSGGSQYSTAPITNFWQADATKPDVDATFLGEVPCGAFVQPPTGSGFVPSTSTTTCFPVPVRQSTETIPLLVAVPNAASGHTKPAGGWPVIIFQHPITGNRTQMLAIAPAFAEAGFVTVAIDMPLHGITDTTSPFYRNQLFYNTPAAGLMTGERTFNLDLENNTTGAPGPDGIIDASGTWFINLGSLLTGRDNLRQSAADLMTLRASLAYLDLNHDGVPDIDTSQIRFSGMSLGAMVGIPFLANDTATGAASLAVPGGGLAKLLDASKTFGPVVSAGLAASGLDEGTDDYETFLRFAQNSYDDGDPLNYAAAARAAHPIHMIEVIGDTVIPNATPANDGTDASLDTVTVASFDAGSDPLYAAMGLTVEGPIDVPVATPTVLVGANLGYVVQFNEGVHSSLLDPTESLAATVEMQTEVTNFLASNGQCLPIGTSCQ